MQTRAAGNLRQSTSTWNYSCAKRLFDFLFATLLFLLALPLLIVIGIAVSCTSAGPALFCQSRLGKDGKQFRLLKFRTMFHDKSSIGPSLTCNSDPRVTLLGRFLRKSKMDELPQLWNVIRGEMSLVGPRPDLPEYMQALNPSQKDIVSLRPGITGAASLRFSDEEHLIPDLPSEERDRYYVTALLPQKLSLDLEYAQRASFWGDLGILLRTVLSPFSPKRSCAEKFRVV